MSLGPRYFAHHEDRAIANYIKTLPEGVPVTLIGHSWGGDTAAKIALGLPKKIATLITVDPVGRFTPWFHSYGSIANSVGRWININAEPSGESTPGDDIAPPFRALGYRSRRRRAQFHLP